MNDQAEFDFITSDTTIADNTVENITISTDSYGDYLTTGNNIYTSSQELELDSSVKDIQNRLVTIEKRLGVLVPDEKLLEQYELLQSLYNQYTAAEALLYDGENNE